MDWNGTFIDGGGQAVDCSIREASTKVMTAKRGRKRNPLPEGLDGPTMQILTEMRAAADECGISLRGAEAVLRMSGRCSRGPVERLLSGKVSPIGKSYVEAFVEGHGLDLEYWLSRYQSYVHESNALARRDVVRAAATRAISAAVTNSIIAVMFAVSVGVSTTSVGISRSWVNEITNIRLGTNSMRFG
ncbi:hypothetical protein ACSHWB_11020 [Lentzea sp. HUAS TT2]|uniref:hypothetical protein n=1 Tax=Lentzea sp. HUAS TT2 TaxID=3447454 RepID=UPI003F7133FC